MSAVRSNEPAWRNLPGEFRPACAEEIRDIHRQTHPIWGGGLARESYVEYWLELAKLKWSKQNLQFWVFEEGGWRSCLKLYNVQAQCNGNTVTGSILGSLFTPPEDRRKGFGSRLTDEVMRYAMERGDEFIWLFSDIDARFYRKFGFTPLPAEECFLAARPSVHPREHWQWAPMGRIDCELLSNIYKNCRARLPFAIQRDPDLWQYLVRRTEAFFRRLTYKSSNSEIWIGKYKDEPMAYAWFTHTRGDGVLREFAVRSETSASEALDSFLSNIGRQGLFYFYSWLPKSWIQNVAGANTRKRHHALPLVHWFGPSKMPQDSEWSLGYQDQF